MAKQPFKFSWIAGGREHHKTIEAETYGEACYQLGAEQARTFDREGVADDFRLELNDEQARLE